MDAVTFLQLAENPAMLDEYSCYIDGACGRQEITAVVVSRSLGPCVRLDGGYTNCPICFGKTIERVAR